MQRTSKWQTHLLHLHLETFKSHNSFSENYKNSKKKKHTDAISWVTELVRFADPSSPWEKSCWTHGSHECDYKQAKKYYC